MFLKSIAFMRHEQDVIKMNTKKISGVVAHAWNPNY
jgi:hypothetical protein